MHLIPRYVNDGTCRLVNSLIKFTDRRRFRIFVGILSRDDVSTQPLLDMGVVIVELDMKHFADLSVTAGWPDHLGTTGSGSCIPTGYDRISSAGSPVAGPGYRSTCPPSISRENGTSGENLLAG